jgi:uncharacterized protein YllA (UPF0747 family)
LNKWKFILFGLDASNPAYVSCLGYPSHSVQATNDTDNNTERTLPETHVTHNPELIEHRHFRQIDKDIERTYPDSNLEKQGFASILKQLTNHFPEMGYTQGINFVVGYFLIIGFSHTDTFWLFVHMAINRRYLLLGLYEEGFPLLAVYTSIFRNMLRRISLPLYLHLY